MFNVKPRPSGKMLKSLREEIEKIFFYKKFLKLKIINVLLIPKNHQAKFLVHFSHLPEARVLIRKGVSSDGSSSKRLLLTQVNGTLDATICRDCASSSTFFPAPQRSPGAICRVIVMWKFSIFEATQGGFTNSYQES